GINLQFCHHLINFDLPWNPMKLEQRIGRIHRIGQENDVNIYNFAVSNTIEERVLNVLINKIQLFEKVIGELDEILLNNEKEQLTEYIDEAFSTSHSEGELKVKLDNLESYIQSISELHTEGENKHVST